MHFTLHEKKKNHTCGGAMSCVCVHLPAIGVYAMWLDALLPLQLPCKADIFNCLSTVTRVCVCVFTFTARCEDQYPHSNSKVWPYLQSVCEQYN